MDGDGVLDRETDKFSSGFDFNDPSNGAILLVGGGPLGTGNLIRDSEDFNGNGFLDSDNPDYIVSFTSPASNDVLSFSETTEWRHYTYFLTNEERQKLVSTRSIRIVVVREDSEDVSGRVLIDRINLNGSSFIVRASSGNVHTEEILERDLSSNYVPPGKDLADVFSEVKDIIATDIENRVLGILWSFVSLNDGFSVEHYLKNPVSRLVFNELVFYVGYCGDKSGGSMSLELVDSMGRGVVVNLEISSISGDAGLGWHRVTVELDRKLVFIDGVLNNGGSVTVDSSFSQLSRLRIGVRGVSSGFIFLDEVLLKRPEAKLGAAIKADFDYSIKGPIYTLGGVDCFSDLRIRGKTYFATPGFSSLYGSPLSYYTYFSSFHNNFKLFGSNVGIDFSVNGKDKNVYFTLGHTLDVPVYGFPLLLSDHYYEKFGQLDEFSKSNGVNLSLSGVGGVNLNFKSDYVDNSIQREWNGSVNLSFKRIFKGSASASISRSEIDYSHSSGNYFSDWLGSFNLLNPAILALEVDRGIRIKSGNELSIFNLGGVSIGVKSQICGNVHTFNFTETSQDTENLYEVSFSFPLEFVGADGLTIEPEYKRSLSLTLTRGYTNSLLTDLYTLWNGVLTNPYFYNEIPFVELYDTSLFTDVINSSDLFKGVDYVPSVSLTLSRNYGSYLSDLFLPSSLVFGFQREINSEYSLVSESFKSSLKLKATAINLFGKLGAYSYFNFYKTDEFNYSLYGEIETDKIGTVNSYTLGIIHYINLTGERRDYSIQNTLNLGGNFEDKALDRVKDTLDFSFKWRVWNVPEFFKIMLPYAWARETFLENEENLSYIYLSRDSGDTLLPISFLIEHWTRLKIRKKGFIGINVGTGFSLERENREGISQNIYRMLFNVGLRAKISF